MAPRMQARELATPQLILTKPTRRIVTRQISSKSPRAGPSTSSLALTIKLVSKKRSSESASAIKDMMTEQQRSGVADSDSLEVLSRKQTRDIKAPRLIADEALKTNQELLKEQKAMKKYVAAVTQQLEENKTKIDTLERGQRNDSLVAAGQKRKADDEDSFHHEEAATARHAQRRFQAYREADKFFEELKQENHHVATEKARECLAALAPQEHNKLLHEKRLTRRLRSSHEFAP
ncbi:hypothetical protein B0H63DRAFT_519981 [Podospora didyma]|uniref:Uncharacterized protein n=1 Tax=Podospora didyma TaxID=330526 RepID=A0AAE0P0F7_9PEZI|nr:hypothetical protein B0H63DRAFT_519981 [Podospora didyma]